MNNEKRSESGSLIDKKTGSHPSIRFEQIPIIRGKLTGFDRVRPLILRDIVEKTEERLAKSDLDTLLSESLFQERHRLKRAKSTIFTRNRLNGDRQLWNHVQKKLISSPIEYDRRQVLRMILNHYAEEIGGHFKDSVYWTATRAVPWGFSWLLNAASVKRVLPWGMSESLASRLQIVGEVPFIQNLSKKGTILLVPTHQSNIDSVLIGYIIYLMSLPPFAYGAGLNLFSNPMLSFFMSNLGAYTVDRQKQNPIYKAILKNYSTRILGEGVHSIFFPGGGRSRSGEIESKVKLGLLGTGLESQIEAMKRGKKDSRVYVVPMVTSYNFVLEAQSLIEDYLSFSGGHRFIYKNDESFQPSKVLGFFWRLFSSQSVINVRIGRPLDVFGNDVDFDGNSIGPNNTTIDPVRWVTTRGELNVEPQRDHEYTGRLGKRLIERFHAEYTVLPSHLVAFSFFEALRKKYPSFELFRFLRLDQEQRSLLLRDYLESAERFQERVLALADQGKLFVDEAIRNRDVETWVREGVRQIGLLHDKDVLRIEDNVIWTENMNLLYYYRNRLTGFGLSRLSNDQRIGYHDAQQFLE